MTTNLQKLWIF